jgi:drug/metabolite transporter (DMT)-like permease
MTETKKLHLHLALFTTSFLFGLSYVLTKMILQDVPPRIWTLYRVLIAAITLFPLAYRAGGITLVFKAWRRPLLWIAGALGVALNQLLFAEGLKRTSPSHSSLINACIPAITMIFSVIGGREGFSLQRMAGILCAICGVAVLLGGPAGDGALSGDLLTLANVSAFSLFLVIGQSLAVEFPAIALTNFYFVEAILILGGWYFLNLGLNLGSGDITLATDFAIWKNAPLKTHALMIFVAVTASTINYVLNNWSLRRATPSMVAAYISMQPVIAAALSAFLFGERLKENFFSAFVLVVTGVLVAASANRQMKTAIEKATS